MADMEEMRMMTDEEDPSDYFATAVIRLGVPESVSEESLKEYLNGIGRAIRSFEGYVSRKIIEVPGPPRLLVPVLKFRGSSAEEAYKCMMRWTESEELRLWLKRGSELGLRYEEREYLAQPVGQINLFKRETRPPPKWKLAIIIEVWVFLAVVGNGAAGTGEAFFKAFGGNAPFALLALLATVVPMMSYAALPLTLSLGFVAQWAHRRASSPGDVVALLEDGFLLFSAGEKTDLASRVESLERRLEASLRWQKPSRDTIARVKRENKIKLCEQQNLFKLDAEDEEAEEEGGVTVAARHHVRWDSVAAFKDWCEEMSAAMRTFDGFLGSDVFRLIEGSMDFVALFRFATLEQMERWLDSDARAEQLAKLPPLVEASSVYADVGKSLRLVAAPHAHHRTQRNLLGELLFSENNKRPEHQPPVYKGTILTIFGLFFIAWPISAYLGPRLEHAIHIPILAALIQVIITVNGTVYFGAPFMHFLFEGWLSLLPPSPTTSDPPIIAAIKRFLVVGPKTNTTRLLILLCYFGALVLGAVF